jgi:Delta6-protoilludene synthase
MQKDLDAICQEADDRAQGRVRAIEDYLALRRYTSGIEPCLHMALLWKGLPDEIWNHPRIQDLNIGCLDLIILSNVRISE